MLNAESSKTVKWILLSPLVLIFIGIIGCEINKAYWDHQVKLMCEKDGGVIIFEKVELTSEEYSALPRNGGLVTVPIKSLTRNLDKTHM